MGEEDMVPLAQTNAALRYDALQSLLIQGVRRVDAQGFTDGDPITAHGLRASLAQRVRGLLATSGAEGSIAGAVSRTPHTDETALAALHWYTVWPVLDGSSLASLESLASNDQVRAGRPFWLFDARLVTFVQGQRLQDAEFYVARPAIGFHFFLREVVYQETRLLVPRLVQQPPFEQVSVVNLTPVIAHEAWDGYDDFVARVMRHQVEAMLPVGLGLDG